MALQPATTETTERARKWLARLSRLNPATGSGHCRGKAPHKPLLLLSMLDMIEGGELLSPTLTRTPGLVVRFKSYGSIAADRWPTRLNIAMPFFHLSTQGFWEPFTAEGTRAASPESCSVCEVHPEFFELLTQPAFRQKARLLLLARYFPPAERAGLLESMGLPAEAHAAAEHEMREVDAEAAEAAKRKGRDARFAVGVVARYKFTCALTGLSCVTTNGAVVVEAAHIDPWSKSLNDDLTNGLALCRNAHWAFDEGLWSVAGDGSIMVAQQRFAESGPNDLCLFPYRGKPLQFAAGVSLRPSGECLASHRKSHGFGVN